MIDTSKRPLPSVAPPTLSPLNGYYIDNNAQTNFCSSFVEIKLWDDKGHLQQKSRKRRLRFQRIFPISGVRQIVLLLLALGLFSQYLFVNGKSSPLPLVFIRVGGGGAGSDSYEHSSSSKNSDYTNSKGKGRLDDPFGTRVDSTKESHRRHPWVVGLQKEFSIFNSLGSRGGGKQNSLGGSMDFDDDDDDDSDYLMQMENFRRKRRGATAAAAADSPLFRASYPSSPNNSEEGSSTLQRKWKQQQRQQYQQQRRNLPIAFQQVQDWWMTNVSPNLQSLPKIVCRVEPTTTLKLRKTFRPLKTIIRLGADFNTQLGVWQFKSSWEDAIIGGKLTLAMKELQFTKSWQLSVGAMEDLVTRLRFRAAINLQTFQAYARVGFRTERVTPINVVEGFTILKRIPLDGQRGSVKLEVKANVALPEPEIEYSTETQRSLIGMGDVEVSIDELNLLLDF